MAVIIKNTPANAGYIKDTGLIPGSGGSPGEGNCNPLQYLVWRISDRRAWWATVRRVAKSWTWLKQLKWSEVLVLQLSPTLCDPMDCSQAGSSVHGIFQARILEWVAISFSRGSSWPRDWTQVPWTISRFFTDWAMREALCKSYV